MGLFFKQSFSKKQFPEVTPLFSHFIAECCERQSSSYCTMNELAYAFMMYLLHAMDLRLKVCFWINDSPGWWTDGDYGSGRFDPRKWHTFSTQAVRAHLAEIGLCEIPTSNGDSIIVGITLLRILDGIKGTVDNKLILKYREGDGGDKYIELFPDPQNSTIS